MTIDGWIGIGALGVSGVTMLMTFLRTARIQGADRQRIKALEDALDKHATIETVGSLGARLELLDGELKKVAAAINEISIVKEKVEGLDRLVTTQLDEIKYALRRMEGRSFDPPAERPRGRRPSTP